MNIPITIVHERLGREPFAIYELLTDREIVIWRQCANLEECKHPYRQHGQWRLDALVNGLCPVCIKEEEPIAL